MNVLNSRPLLYFGTYLVFLLLILRASIYIHNNTRCMHKFLWFSREMISPNSTMHMNLKLRQFVHLTLTHKHTKVEYTKQ
jgi:hypothetical protein